MCRHPSDRGQLLHRRGSEGGFVVVHLPDQLHLDFGLTGVLLKLEVDTSRDNPGNLHRVSGVARLRLVQDCASSDSTNVRPVTLAYGSDVAVASPNTRPSTSVSSRAHTCPSRDPSEDSDFTYVPVPKRRPAGLMVSASTFGSTVSDRERNALSAATLVPIWFRRRIEGVGLLRRVPTF